MYTLSDYWGHFQSKCQRKNLAFCHWNVHSLSCEMSSRLIFMNDLAQIVHQLQSQIRSQHTMLTEVKEFYKWLKADNSSQTNPRNTTWEVLQETLSHLWIIYMDNYLENKSRTNSLPVVVSYLANAAHRRMVDCTQKTDKGKLVQSLAKPKQTIVCRFDTINNEEIVRNRLARCREMSRKL